MGVVRDSIADAGSINHDGAGKTSIVDPKIAATSLVSLNGSIENQSATPKSDRHESIILENTSFSAGSSGMPSTLDADLSSTVSQCSVFGLPGVGVSEVDNGGRLSAIESLGKHVYQEMKTDLQGMVTAGNGYDSLCCVLSPSKKGYSGQDVANCNPDLPAAGILETTDAPEVVEVGKGHVSRVSFPTSAMVSWKAEEMVWVEIMGIERVSRHQ